MRRSPAEFVAGEALSVVALLEAACSRHASRAALTELDIQASGIVEGRTISYATLFDRADRLVAGLRAAGLVRGDRLCVLLDNCIELVVTEWACLLSGIVWVALNARSSSAEVRDIVADCDPSMIVAGREYVELLARAAPESRVVCVETSDWAALLAETKNPAIDNATTRPRAEDAVRLRYTSGTAGRPKGAVLPRRAYDASVAAVASVIAPIEAADVLIQVAPMTHASGAMLLPHVSVGARTLLLRRFDARALIDVCERYRATAMFLVPTMLIRVLDAIDDSRRMHTMRTIVYGGASMAAQRLADAVEMLGPIFVQIYGLTESTWPVAALLRDQHLRAAAESRDSWHRRLRSCGRATDVGELRIVSRGGIDVTAGEAGEVWVRGRNTMSGYWGGDTGTDAKGLDAQGWMHTGDIATCDADGYLTIVDRLHDMIVSGGFNVYPREVEDALSSHPAVLECAVVGRSDTEWGETVHAFVVVRDGQAVTADVLVAHCTAVVARYKKPHSIEFIGALPKNAAGKVLRRELRERLNVRR
jgi:acyl-CoA synthetase (AMP-forming)/AMP-acid ligase II